MCFCRYRILTDCIAFCRRWCGARDCKSAISRLWTGRALTARPITAFGIGCGSAWSILSACGGSFAGSSAFPNRWRLLLLVDMSHAIGAYLTDVFITRLDWWVLLGLLAQALFTARFLVQWIASERAGHSVIPMAFWLFSIGGGILLLVYALYRKDVVFIAGQAFGVFVYLRNLYFVMRDRKVAASAA